MNLERIIALGTILELLIKRINERGTPKEDVDYIVDRLNRECNPCVLSAQDEIDEAMEGRR